MFSYRAISVALLNKFELLQFTMNLKQETRKWGLCALQTVQVVPKFWAVTFMRL